MKLYLVLCYEFTEPKFRLNSAIWHPKENTKGTKWSFCDVNKFTKYQNRKLFVIN